MTHEADRKTVKILGEIDAHIERLKPLAPSDAVALQRTHSLLCCIQFRAWIRSGRASVRGIPLAKALKQEQHLLLIARKLRKTGCWQASLQ
jgi:hypothetical protein